MRHLIERIEGLEVLSEKKDHLIKKLTKLTPSEKKDVMDFFKDHPNMENKIDWNRKDLAYDAFKSVMATKASVNRGNIIVKQYPLKRGVVHANSGIKDIQSDNDDIVRLGAVRLMIGALSALGKVGDERDATKLEALAKKVSKT